MLLSTKTRLEARITQRESVLAALYAEETNFDPIKSFELDTGEASQRVTRRSLRELREEITFLEAELEALYRRLNGLGIVRTLAIRRA